MKSVSVRKPTTPASTAIWARDVAVDLAGWPRNRFTSANTYLTARFLHILTIGLSSSTTLAASRKLPFSPHKLEHGAPPLDSTWTQALHTLDSDGITMLPHLLDSEAIDRVVAFARTAPANLTDSAKASTLGTYESRGARTKGVRIVEHFVLNNADIQSVIGNKELIALTENYFRTKVLVHPPQLYWSCAPSGIDAQMPDGEDALQSAEEFHWDFDGVGGVRLHMYLTDVDQDSAPMKYMRASHKPGTLKSKSLRNADRGVKDAAVWQRFSPDDAMTVTGPAGTTFMSNSHGLHRGTPARTRDRLFLVMPFQATSFAGYQLKPRPVTPKDPGFAALLAQGSPAMRWFRPTNSYTGSR